MKKRITGACAAIAAALFPLANALAHSDHGLGKGGAFHHGISHVLLISVDGMHAVDFANCASGFGNNGASYCPNLAALGQHGVNYVDTSTSKPSDSFPGLMALVTGGSPRTVGAYYDVAYDRVLAPPAQTTGNGVQAGACTPGQPNGTRTEYEEGISFDQTQLNGGAPSGDGGVNSIDPNRLIRDPFNNCAPVYPWNFIRTNTIFGVVHQAGGYTAWADKHPAYAAVAGPGDGTNVDDYYAPEINSTSIALPQVTTMACNPLPDALAFADGDDYTGSFQNIQCYDSLKVDAILNEIDGKTHNGGASAPVPQIFGMNFQAISIGQKLIYQHGAVASGYSEKGGYLDALGTPSPSLMQEIEFVDNSIGLMVAELNKQGLADSTMIVITAKHGQSPIDPNRYDPIPLNGGATPATLIASLLPSSESPTNPNGIGATEDDVSLLWLVDSSQTANAVATLESNAAAAGISEIFTGPALALLYNSPGLPPNGDPRTPDIIVAPNVGVVYTGSKKKLAEHGGFAHDDTNVIMLVANSGFSAATVVSPVETAQVAPTIVKALGLDPSELQAVQQEHTQVLPGLSFHD